MLRYLSESKRLSKSLAKRWKLEGFHLLNYVMKFDSVEFESGIVL